MFVCKCFYVFKETKDQRKFDKARRLNEFLCEIRRRYQEDFFSQNEKECQRAVALYFIDKVKSSKNFLNSHHLTKCYY